MRHDFAQATKIEIAMRAGGFCSHPECPVNTFGPKQGDKGYVNVGVAAHITAASVGGPRYDASLTSEQRRAQSNGIWLCQIHAHLVDSDEKAFPVETLRRWKKTVEDRRIHQLGTLKASQGQEIVPTFQTLDDLEDQQNIELLTSKVREQAKRDIARFKSRLGWPSHPIALNLRIPDVKGMEEFTVAGLAQILETFTQIAVVASPGTGKTTTLIQLIDNMLSIGRSVATFIPLSEWSSQSEPFLQYLVHRLAFSDTSQEQLKLLADHRRLVLVMDGWNELDEQGKKRARYGIESLLRDFPNLGIVVSTRRQAQDVPLSGPRIQIGALSENQQLEIARSLRGPDGETILDHAWRTPGINELVTNPLYLTTLLSHASGKAIPTTREEVLRLFVSEQERAQAKREVLQETTSGFHSRILIALATEATRAANTTISDANTRAIISTVQNGLAAEGQIQLLTAPQPSTVLDILVSHHLLIRSGLETNELSFQHQQFQEWYASFQVEDLLFRSAEGDKQARATLRADILNIPTWEEPILFACERVSRANTKGAQVVATAILGTLGIDPLLASEMIYRSSSEVWGIIKHEVLAFVGRWHASGRVDRALHFMVNTGRSDFAPQIWPLIVNLDDQVHLAALRAGRRFRPSVLGPKIEDLLTPLPEKVREHIVSEMIHQSGMDGIDLGAKIAKADKSVRVKTSAVEALLFRRADRIAADILREAPDEVWKEIVTSGHWEEIDDPDASVRFLSEKQKYLSDETDSLRKTRFLLTVSREGKTDGLGPEIAKLIKSTDFPVRSHEAGWMIQEAYRLCPSDVTNAILHRLEAGQDIPFGSRELLRQAGVEVDEGPIVELVLNPNTAENVAEAAVTIVGPQTIGKLIDQIVATYSQIQASGEPSDEAKRKQFRGLSALLSKAGEPPFFQAILSRASTADPTVIEILAERIIRHHQDEPKGRQPLQGQLHDKMVDAVERWGETLLTNPCSNRHQLADVAGAIQRLASPKLVTVLGKMLAEDLSRWRRAREQAATERKAGRRINLDSSHSYTNQYRAAFAAIGTTEVIELMKGYLPDTGFTGFGEDAAWVLKEIHGQDKTTTREQLFAWGIDFSEVNLNRENRQKGLVSEPSETVEAILKVVRSLLQPDAGESKHRHALRLACVAFRMPYDNQTETISKLLALPLPLSEKQTLLAVLVQAGEILSADIVLEGIRSLLEEAKTKTWLLDKNSGRLEQWLMLLPFTDRPTTTLDALRLLDPTLRQPWDLGGLLNSLGHAPSIEAEHVLKALALEDVRFLKYHAWHSALDRRGTASAGLILLDLMCSGQAIGSGDGIDSWSLINRLAIFIKKYPEMREETYRRHRSLPHGNSKTLIARAIAEAADEEGVMALLLDHTSPDIISAAVRKVAMGERPSSDWAGAVEFFSPPLPELRKKLFSIACSNSPESSMAKACLNTIDEIRDEYGTVESEPRHPNIHSGQPWPPEANLEEIKAVS